MSPVGTTVFKDIAASDKDAGVNKNIDFAIVAGNGDIVSYVCFYVILYFVDYIWYTWYLQSNQSHMTVDCTYNYGLLTFKEIVLKYFTKLNCGEKKF